MNWLDACGKFGTAQRLDTTLLSVLSAFPQKTRTHAVLEVRSFKELEAMVPRLQGAIETRLESHLTTEVDGQQASMFARRYQAVQDMLEKLAPRDPGARALRAGFACRMTEMMESSPTALRVRAIIDFYFSQAAIRHHRLQNPAVAATPTLRGLVEQTRWQKIQRGLFHRLVSGMTQKGPVNLNALRFDRGRFDFLAVDYRTAVTAGVPFAQSILEAGGAAGFSGGYFLYSEPNIEAPAARYDPVGLLVSGGQVLNPPIYSRPAFMQDDEGRVHIATIGLKGLMLRWPDGVHFRIGGTNAARRINAMPVAFNRADRTQTPLHEGHILTIIAQQLTAVQRGGQVAIPVGGFVVTLPATPEWDELGSALAVDTRVTFELPSLPGIRGVSSAIAGGPTLLEGGRTSGPRALLKEEFTGDAEPMTFSTDETGDLNLLPRLAIGLTPAHDVIVMAADGRNFGAALGLTLAEVTGVMRALGCVDAINMDGGSSKRLVLQNQPLDLPTTEIVAGAHVEESIRPVHNGFLARPREEEPTSQDG